MTLSRCSSSVGFCAFFLAGLFGMYQHAHALSWTGTPAELHGYAWSDTIGWISLNCDNISSPPPPPPETDEVGNPIESPEPELTGCDLSDYKVEIINDDGDIEGWAWSDSVGWIKFGGLSGFPSDGDYTGGNTQVNDFVGTLYFSGFARACAGTASGDCSTMEDHPDGWDGWIMIGYQNPAVHVFGPILNNGSLSGWSWGSDVIGWIDWGAGSASYDPPATEGYFACEHNPPEAEEKAIYQDQWGNLDAGNDITCGLGEVCSDETFSCEAASEPTVNDFTVTIPVVRAGETVTVDWDVSTTYECQMTSTEGDSWVGLTGSETSTQIENRTVFTLACRQDAVSSFVDLASTTVNLLSVPIEL